MTTYGQHITEGIFADLDAKLDRPDCKRARSIVAQTGRTYSLRDEREEKPLVVNDIWDEEVPLERKKWLAFTAAVALILLISAFASYLSGVHGSAAARASEGVNPQTIISPYTTSPGAALCECDFYPPLEQ